MAKSTPYKLTLYLRGRIWWISAHDPESKGMRYMSLETDNRSIARSVHKELTRRWNSGEDIFPQPVRGDGRALSGAINSFLLHRKGMIGARTWSEEKLRLDLLRQKLPVDRPDRITKTQISDYFASLARRRKPSTYNSHLNSVRQFLAWCADRGLAKQDLTADLKARKVEEKPIKFLSAKERDLVLKAAEGSQYEAMVATALLAGLRLGELKRLQWSDISFSRGQGHLVVTKSKTKNQRQVPISKRLAEILKAAKAKGRKRKRCFPEISGNLKRYCATLSERASELARGRTLKQIEKQDAAQRLEAISGPRNKRTQRARPRISIKFNWLIARHTFASLLAQRGIPLIKVAKWLGHSRFDVTLRHYATIAPGYDEAIEE